MGRVLSIPIKGMIGFNGPEGWVMKYVLNTHPEIQDKMYNDEKRSDVQTTK